MVDVFASETGYLRCYGITSITIIGSVKYHSYKDLRS